MTTVTAGAAPDRDFSAPLHTDEDILRRVDLLLDDNARQLHSVLLLFLAADGVQLPLVIPIDNVPEPDPLVVGNLCWIIAEALTRNPGASAVVVLTRPETDHVNHRDRRWSQLLRAGARQHRAPIRMVCLATPAAVLRLPADGTASVAF
jgi:hypothetical protein